MYVCSIRPINCRASGKFPTILANFWNNYRTEKNMSQLVETSVKTKNMLQLVKLVVPPLCDTMRKGQAGRIGVIGGSLEYTGAPYFAAISALRVGADLVHVFCHREAAPVIKSYSPELIVHPVLNSENAVELIKPWLERLHVMVVGPGLGREQNMLDKVAKIIELCKKTYKPLIVDADGLFLINNNKALIKNYKGAILTPNAMEFRLLFGELPEAIVENMKELGNGVIVLQKGNCDKIYVIADTLETYHLSEGGSGRRCGGQGDLLSGSLATFYHWTLESNQANPAFIATFAGSFMAKQCNEYAFKKHGRSMVASDMIDEIHNVFEDFFE